MPRAPRRPAETRSAKKPPAGSAWRSRIISTGEVRAGDLLANENNWRLHPKSQQEALTGVLDTVGLVQHVVVNRRTSRKWPRGQQSVETLVDGHLRAELALSKGEDTTLPVVYVDLNPDEERFLLASLDPVGAMAGKDKAKLAELMNMVPDDLRHLAEFCQRERSQLKELVQFEAKQELGGLEYRVVVDCRDEVHQTELLERFEKEGLPCRALIS